MLQAVNALNLRHVVITSVDRDDLDDGGANQFALCIKKIRELNKEITIRNFNSRFSEKKKMLLT